MVLHEFFFHFFVVLAQHFCGERQTLEALSALTIILTATASAVAVSLAVGLAVGLAVAIGVGVRVGICVIAIGVGFCVGVAIRTAHRWAAVSRTYSISIQFNSIS